MLMDHASSYVCLLSHRLIPRLLLLFACLRLFYLTFLILYCPHCHYFFLRKSRLIFFIATITKFQSFHHNWRIFFVHFFSTMICFSHFPSWMCKGKGFHHYWFRFTRTRLLFIFVLLYSKFANLLLKNIYFAKAQWVHKSHKARWIQSL